METQVKRILFYNILIDQSTRRCLVLLRQGCGVAAGSMQGLRILRGALDSNGVGKFSSLVLKESLLSK